jgi:RhoGEF domain
MADPLSVALVLDCGKAVAKMSNAPRNTPRAWFAFQDQRINSARRRTENAFEESEEQQLSTSLRRIYSEIYNTELVYEAQLDVIDKVILRPAVALGLKCSPPVQAFVDGISQLARLHADVVRSMQLEGGSEDGGLLLAFSKALPFMKIYKMVIAGYAQTERCLEDLTARSLHYVALLREADVTLSAFLIRPLQRVYKYHLLFQTLRKYTDPVSSTVPLVEALCKRSHEIADYLDLQQGLYESADRLRSLYNALAQWGVLDPGCTSPLHITKEGTVSVCLLMKQKPAMLRRTITLLPVAVVISLMDERGDYLVEDIAPLSSIIVEMCPEDAQVHGLRLHWLKRGQPVEILLAFGSSEEHAEWMRALRLVGAELTELQPQMAMLQRKLGHQLMSPRSPRSPRSSNHQALVRFARRGSVELAHKLGARRDRSRAGPPISPRQDAALPPRGLSSHNSSSANRLRRRSTSMLVGEGLIRFPKSKTLPQSQTDAGERRIRFGKPKKRSLSQNKVSTVQQAVSAPTFTKNKDLNQEGANITASHSAPASGSAEAQHPSKEEVAVMRARRAARKLRSSRALSNLETRSLRAICQSGRT